jgi:hypothetical protein
MSSPFRGLAARGVTCLGCRWFGVIRSGPARGDLRAACWGVVRSAVERGAAVELRPSIVLGEDAILLHPRTTTSSTQDAILACRDDLASTLEEGLGGRNGGGDGTHGALSGT